MAENHPVPRTQWDRERVQVAFTQPSLTEQSHAEGCSIKLIMQRYTNTGEFPVGRSGKPQFVNVPDQDIDFSQIQQTIAATKSLYHGLDDEAKDKFSSESDFLQAVANPSRQAELVEKGIITETQPELSLTDSGGSDEPPTPADTSPDGAESTQKSEAPET